MTRTAVLIVEDESIVALGLQDRLERLGYDVAGIVDSGESAVIRAVEHRPDIILMDINLAGEMDGVAAAAEIRSLTNIPIIYLTAFNDDETVKRAAFTEPMNYLHKPCQDRDIRTAVEMALFKHAAERERRRSEQQYSATVRSIADAIITTDAEGRILLLNPAAERITGWRTGDAFGQPCETVLALFREGGDEPIPPPVAASLASRTVVEFGDGSLLRAPNGGQLPVEGAVAPIVDDVDGSLRGAVVAFRDTSVRKAAEASIRRGERLESLGLVAAGVAHQANNLLTVILGSSEFARMDLPTDSPVVPLLDEIDTAARTLARIADQMLMYTAASVRRTATLDLSDVIRGAAPRIEGVADGLASVTFDLAPGLPLIEGNTDQLQQALVNLVTNAAEAVDGAGGSIVVRSGLRQATADELKLAVAGSDRAAGAYVFLEVRDTGPGIPDDVQRSMFDPFFSTKFTGRGLGLAAVHGIARMHRAALLVSSTPGGGTTIALLFTPAV